MAVVSTVDENGYFEHTGYGYTSLEKFIDAARLVSAGERTAASFELSVVRWRQAEERCCGELTSSLPTSSSTTLYPRWAWFTLLVDWQNVSDPNQRGTAVYTASWAAPLKAGVHSEQRFHYMHPREVAIPVVAEAVTLVGLYRPSIIQQWIWDQTRVQGR
jgi:hypothetical protein